MLVCHLYEIIHKLYTHKIHLMIHKNPEPLVLDICKIVNEKKREMSEFSFVLFLNLSTYVFAHFPRTIKT